MVRFKLLVACASGVFLSCTARALVFTPGSLVISVEGNGVVGAASGPYADNQASPLTLFQYAPVGTTSATYTGSLVLPQQGSGANSAISAEYGSTSEGMLQLSGDGTKLVIAGYGINADTFNANPTAYGTAVNDPSKPTALAQSGSLTGQSYTPVSRVVALIGADGSVDTSTQLYNVFNGNNPRSAYTLDGKAIYVSGQGTGGDSTAGVFYTTVGSSSATPITGNDTTSKTQSQDTRDVQVYNNQLYVSTDSKGGKNAARDFVGTLGTIGALPTGLANGGNGPAMLPGYGNSGGTGKLVLNAQTANGIGMAGQEINLSPEGFFFANATTLYVADSGSPKNDSAKTTFGDGGLQKWVFANGSWSLQYTLSAGLNLVANSATAGTTGLLSLTGLVSGDNVQLYATNYAIGDTDQTYLYGIGDSLSQTSKSAGQVFSQLAAAPADSTFKGVSFAPAAVAGAVPEPGTYALMILGFGMLGGALRRRKAAEVLTR